MSVWERAAQFMEGNRRQWETPGAIAAILDRRTNETPALRLIDQALIEALDTPDSRVIITMPPQEGKSTRVARDFPVWALHQDPELRIVTASYGQGLANRNGRAIRNAVQSHPELGISIAGDNGAVHEWSLAGHRGGVLSVGIGAGVTGRPADLMVIDDPIKDRKEADSKVFRQSVWDWWTDSASTRLAPGAPVVVILTRWHQDDLAGRLLAAEDGHLWSVINIPAVADHDPEKGETDPLGREVGEFMDSARKWTTSQWEAKRTRSGSRTWNALYQGRPSAVEGEFFKRTWWQEYAEEPWVVRRDGSCFVLGMDEMLMSWDMTFKDTEGTDFVAGGVWMRRGVDVYLLDLVCERMDFVQTLASFRQQAAKWPQAVMKLVEDKANGPAVISSLARQVSGIIPEEPHGGKEARAAAVSPLVEAGNVWLPSPEIAPWIGAFIDQHADFPNATHDDMVDQTTQALNRLILQPLMRGDDIYGVDDFDEELAGFSISPY